jgi:nucleoside-diphosphate-sugar epimerase
MSKTIVVTGARAPAALHLARVFHAAGHRIILADTFRYPMSRATRMKDSYARLPPPRRSFSDYAAAVQALVAREAPDLIVPTCEEVFRCLRRISICLRRSTTRRILPRWPWASAPIRP